MTGRLSQTAARQEALTDARVNTELLANSVAAPNIPKGMADARPRRHRPLHAPGGRDLLHPKARHVQRIKIWSSDGTVLYSDQPDLIRKKFKLDPEQLDVLNSGATEGSVSDLRRSENKFETEEDGLLEVYTRIDSPEGKPLLFEAYYPVQERSGPGFRGAHAVPADQRARAARGPAPRRPDDLGADTAPHPRQPGTRAADGAGDRLLGGRAAPDRSRPPRRCGAGAGRHGVRALRGRPRAECLDRAPLRPGPRQRGPAPHPAPAEVAAGRDPPAGTERRWSRGGAGGPHRPGRELGGHADA